MSIQETGTSVATVEVKIGPQFLNLFSEHLYSSPNKAFEELVSNSWDAGARRVYVDVPADLKSPTAAIWVLDDGGAMDIDGFQALWSVATSSKRSQEVAGQRKPIGKFGVGKLATYLLAHELTYVCKAADGVIRAVTMDYRRIEGHDKNALHIEALPLKVRIVEIGELPKLLANVADAERILQLISAGVPGPAVDTEFEDDFGGHDLEPPAHKDTWTLAVLSSLKDPGRKLSTGWVRRLLRTSLPLGRTISIYFNNELLSSAKTDSEIANEWVLGAGLKLGDIVLPTGEVFKIKELSDPVPHLEIEGIGQITGRVRLYSEKISGGKSENIAFSNGFFVNVRGRVIKPEDPYFGLDNLSHSVWARFRATIRADGLDGRLSVNREAIADSVHLQIFRTLLMKLFNKTRNDFDSRTAGSWPAVGEILTEKWGVVPFEPLKRVVEESLAGTTELPRFVYLPSTADREQVKASWKYSVKKASGEMITDVVIAELGKDAELSRYDLETRTVVVNKDHPFAVEHQENGQQLRVLRDAALVELLTEAFMSDIGLTVDQLQEIRVYRDRAYRLVAQVRRRSAAQIANMLIQVTDHAKGFERIIGDALEYIGFSVQRLGQTGQPEGVATAVISPAAENTKVAYRFTYDAKSAQNGKVQTHNVGAAGLARHRRDHNADHTLVVAPNFQAGALEQECAESKITPILAHDLARLVMITVGYGPLNLVDFRTIFDLHSPDAVKEWVDDLIEKQKNTKHVPLGVLIQALIVLANDGPDMPDTLHCAQIAAECRKLLGNNQYPGRNDVASAIRGLSLMAPNVVSISNQDVMLNTSASKLSELIFAQVTAIPDGYRYGMTRGLVQ